MKYITILLLLFSIALLGADPLYYPTTPVVENFGAIWCGACDYALAGLDAMEAELAENEAIISRLLTESGQYSNPEVEGRFTHYEVLGLPAVIFNGKVRVDGASDDTANGEDYLQAISQFRYLASPLKMSMENFDSSTGDFAVMIEMIHDTFSLDGTLWYYLVEDDIDEDLSRIVRSVQSQAISLSGAGNFLNEDITFSVDPAWNSAKLWAFAFVQVPGNAIIQAASTLPQPDYYLRAAVPFGHDIQSDDPGIYESPNFWIYNMGEADDVTISIETISAPDGWALNYCDIDGNCYPGTVQIPFNFLAGEARSFDLNIWAEGNGTAVLNFVVESQQSGIYKVPFSYTLGPVSNADMVAPVMDIRLGQGFPNPFQSSVTFSVESSKAGQNAALEIFNVRGQKLQELPLKELKQGSNSIRWDAGHLANGLYFYRLKDTRQSGRILKLN
jgi:thiol-disulfide isomerase/thioredoxin